MKIERILVPCVSESLAWVLGWISVNSMHDDKKSHVEAVDFFVSQAKVVGQSACGPTRQHSVLEGGHLGG